MYGGVDILYHTIKAFGVYEQGITFHKMSRDFDYGQIISKVTYPATSCSTVFDLYKRLDSVFPNFVLSSLKLLEVLSEDDIDRCYAEKPRISKRGNIDPEDDQEYKDALVELRKHYER